MTPDEERRRARLGVANVAGMGEAIHDRIAAKVDKRKVDVLAGILERFEGDYAPHLAGILGAVVDNPAIPEPIRTLVSEVIDPQHFTSSILLGIALGATLSPVIGAATAPFVQVLANETWPTLPVIPLSPDLLAAAVIKGVLTEAQAASLAHVSGTDGANFHTMVMTAGQSMGAEEALLLLRRAQINRAEFDRIIHYSNVRDDFIPDILKLMFAPPAAGTVIAGALKGWLTDADARTKLGEAGIDPVNYQWLKDSSGRPPGMEQMLHLLNRGKATQAQVDQAIRQSDINDNYLPFVHELRWYIPPVRSIMAMLRAQAITDAQATTLFTENGVRPEDIPGYLKEAHHSKGGSAKELSGAQVVRMYSGRFMTQGDATSRLTAIGYPAGDVTMLLGFADDQRRERLRAALTTKVGSAYVAHKIDKATATADLSAGGVDGAAQTDLFHVWDLERSTVKTDRLQNALIAKIGSLYVAHHLDQAGATAAMTADAIPADLQAQLLAVWNLERGANIHHPSPAQVVHAYRQAVITAHDCHVRLLALGVQPVDIPIIVANGWPPTQATAAKAAALAVAGA